LLMGRKLRSTVPIHPDKLKPELPNHDLFKRSNDQYKEIMKENHNKNPKVRPLLPENKGDKVMVRDMQRESYAASSLDNITRRTNVMADTGPLIRNRADITNVPIRCSEKTRKVPYYLTDFDCT